MKLIIDIPDNQYNQICELRLHNRTIFDDAIRKGIPLNEVLDKIRAEIKALEKPYGIHTEDEYEGAWNDAIDLVLTIIDQYRKE